MMKDGVALDIERVKSFANLTKTRAGAFTETIVHAASVVAFERYCPQRLCCFLTEVERSEATGQPLADRAPAQIEFKPIMIGGAQDEPIILA